MEYMGYYHDMPKAIFYLRKWDYRVVVGVVGFFKLVSVFATSIECAL